jgi:hypothetical protein
MFENENAVNIRICPRFTVRNAPDDQSGSEFGPGLKLTLYEETGQFNQSTNVTLAGMSFHIL